MESITSMDIKENTENIERSLDMPPTMSELRIVLLGKNAVDISRVGNFVLDRSAFETKVPPASVEQHSERARGHVMGRYITIINTPHLFHPQLSVDQITLRIKECVSLADPGPHALLLLIQPDSFTEEDRSSMMNILRFFCKKTLEYCMVVTSQGYEPSLDPIAESRPLQKIILDCGKRHFSFESESTNTTLIEKIEQLVQDNRGQMICGEKAEQLNAREHVCKRLNVVLCGRDAAVKASISDVMLGQREQRAEPSSVCVRREGEVCGHLITLVEMPALYNTQLSEEEVMQQTLHCVCLCHPGVHAFLFTIPEGRLTDEDKAEMEMMQRIFSSRVTQHTIVLISQETQQEDLHMADTTQLSIEMCTGRHHVMLPSSDVSEILQVVEQMVEENKGSCYSTHMYLDAQVETHLRHLKEMIRTVGHLRTNIQSQAQALKENHNLKIVLLGRTGVGKSATGNTILGKEVFKEDMGYYSMTRQCQGETAEVDGRQITVIDTPGLFDIDVDNEEIKKEISKCVYMISPGPHVFLLVLKVGQRFTKEERESVKIIQELFGEWSINYTILLFTRGDDLKNKSIEECFGKAGSDMMKLIEECGNRYHVFNNTERTDHSQVTDLLHKIYSMVEMNGGSCYTNKMFLQVEKERHEEQKRELRMNVAEVERKKDELKDHEWYESQMDKIKNMFQEERQKQELERQSREDEFRKERQILENQIQELKRQTAEISKAATKRISDDLQHCSRETRIVLIGNTGAGKSATGNTILGEKKFRSETGCSSVTLKCEKQQAEVAGRNVSVVDTPGLVNTTLSLDNLRVELERSVCLSSPGPHAYLYVVQLKNKFTEQDVEFVQQVGTVFGQEIRKYTIILLTHGDWLEGKNADAVIRKNVYLARLIDQCCGYHLFNNKDLSNKQQVTELLQKIDRMVEDNKGKYYQMYEKAFWRKKEKTQCCIE